MDDIYGVGFDSGLFGDDAYEQEYDQDEVDGAADEIFGAAPDKAKEVRPQQDGPVAGVLERLTNLPQKLNVSVDRNKVVLAADDFSKILKLIPGFPESKNHDFSKLKSVRIEGNKLIFDGSVTLAIPNPLDARLTLPLKLENFSGELQTDPNAPNRLKFTNISGMKVCAPGIDIHIKEICINVDKDGEATRASVEITKHEAIALPGVLHELVKGQAKSLNEKKFDPLPLPIDSADGLTVVKKVFDRLRGWTQTDDTKKDTKHFAGDLIESLTGNDISQFIPDLQGLEKNGDALKLKFKERPVNMLAGVPVIADKEVTARFSTRDNKVVISNIEGATLALPPDMAALTGKADANLKIEEITLGEPDKDGNRIASVRLGGFIETVKVSLKVGPDLQPLRVDAAGNVSMRLEMKMGEKIAADIQFNPDGPAGKARALYRSLLKREPDAGAAWAVQKFEAGASYKEIAKELINNAAKEFRNSIPANKAEIIPFLYDRLLGRSYGPGEDKGVWMQVLETKGVDAVIDALLDCDEFKAKHPDYLLNVELADGKKDVCAFVEKLTGQPAHQAVKDLLAGAGALTIGGDHTVVFKAAGARSLLNLPLEAGEKISFKIEPPRVAGELVLSNASGIKAQLPIPDELLAKLGCPKDVHFKGMRMTPFGDKGHRVVQVDFDHPQIKHASFVIDGQGKPVPEDGRLVARMKFKVDNHDLDVITTLPSDAKPGATAHIYLTGEAAPKVALLKKLGAPPEIADVAGEVKVVSVKEDSLALHFDKTINANISGLTMQFDKTVVVKALPARQLPMGWPPVKYDVRDIAVSGVKVTGFDFRGNQWKETGSQILNAYLQQQNDLPITISSLYFATSPDSANVRVGLYASEGGLKSAHFVLESKDKPDFVDGTVTVKNPFRNMGLIRNEDQTMTLRLTKEGVDKPVATARDAARPILDDPILKWLPPVRAARTVVGVGEFLEDNGLLPWQW